MIAFTIVLAMQTADLASCLLPNNSCKPWEIVQAERSVKANPFDKYDPPVVTSPCEAAKSCKPWEKYQTERAARPNPYDQFDPKPARLGPGPHTLVISDGSQITRMDYKSGSLCQRAREAIQEQFRTPPNTSRMIYLPSGVKAFCVPR